MGFELENRAVRWGKLSTQTNSFVGLDVMLCLPDLQHQHLLHPCVDEHLGQYQVTVVPVPLKHYKSCNQNLFGKKE